MFKTAALLALVTLAACDLIYPFEIGPPPRDLGHVAGEAVAAELGGADDLAPAGEQPSPADARQQEEQLSPCDKLFMATVPAYLFCSETATTCTFYYHSPNGARSCQDLCGTKTCLKMLDNQAQDDCTLENPNSCSGTPCVCSTKMNDSICTCQK